ncbi:hypothetical protein [Hyphomicrobium sp.]|jgi:hypothetical protein|uniref:hypothetical protein n=1 Tax=Hyphomicrobium sp. TaxID=82 RepID=UPI003564D445
MVDEFAPTNLRARLAAVQDRIVQAKSKLEAHGIVGDQTNALSGFEEQHNAISGSLDTEGTITELQHSKASAQTDALESALHTWLQGIESAFKHPTPQRPNISV